jgi:hypothetical protein
MFPGTCAQGNSVKLAAAASLVLHFTGYVLYSLFFENQVEESLHAIWRTYRDDIGVNPCRQCRTVGPIQTTTAHRCHTRDFSW